MEIGEFEVLPVAQNIPVICGMYGITPLKYRKALSCAL